MPKTTFIHSIKYLFALSCLTLALVSCGKASPSPEAKEAIAGFQKIDSRVELGINITDYLNQVSEAKFTLEKYKALPNANKSAVTALESSLNAHISALDFWNCKIQSSSDGVLAQCQTPKLEALAGKYPEVKSYVDELKQQQPTGGGGNVFWYIDNNKVLSALWNRAKIETAQAQAALD